MKCAQAIIGVAFVFATGCSQQAVADNKLHPVQAVCVDYEQTGSMAGTTTECHRDWGHQRYTIEDLSMSMMGIQQTHNRHTITTDDQITSWDRGTLQGTVTTNPNYDAWADASSDDVETFTDNMLSGMGFSPTGQTKTIAGEDCSVWSSAQMGQMCFTDDALVLEQVMDMGIVSFSRRAVSVRRGDSGDASNYEVPANVTISDGPNLDAILGGLGN